MPCDISDDIPDDDDGYAAADVAPYPLVVVDTYDGGLYETDSFVAGAMFAQIDHTMKFYAEAKAAVVYVPSGMEEETVAAFPGWEGHAVFGKVASRLVLEPPTRFPADCPPACVRQVDLAAMHRGWRIESQGPSPEMTGWVRLIMVRVPDGI